MSKSRLVHRLLKSKKFRDSYVYEHVRNGIPFQIRATRNARDWTQSQLGEASNKPRPVISRLEDPNYGKLTLKTLFEMASAFDMALLVKFVPFSRLVREYEDVSSSALSVKPIIDPNEIAKLEAWAVEDRSTTALRIPHELERLAGRTVGTVSAGSTTDRHPTIILERKPAVRKVYLRRGDRTEPTVVKVSADTDKIAA